MELWIIAAAALVAGTLIGSVSVGGVILVPALVGLAGLPARAAIQLTFAGFAVAGVIAMLTARPGDLRAAWPVLAATIPGAVAGTMLVHVVPVPLVIVVVAAMALGSLAMGLLPRRTGRLETLPPPTAVGFGAVTGFGSALSGSGGPLILMPLLMMVGMDIRRSIRLAQIVQLPIAIAASATHLGYAPLDPAATIAIVLGMAAGTLLGTMLQGRMPASWLKRAAVAAVLFSTAAMLASLARGTA